MIVPGHLITWLLSVVTGETGLCLFNRSGNVTAVIHPISLTFLAGVGLVCVPQTPPWFIVVFNSWFTFHLAAISSFQKTFSCSLFALSKEKNTQTKRTPPDLWQAITMSFCLKQSEGDLAGNLRFASVWWRSTLQASLGCLLQFCFSGRR